MEGIEPTTPRLQITSSGQLSYIGNGVAKIQYFVELQAMCRINLSKMHFLMEVMYWTVSLADFILCSGDYSLLDIAFCRFCSRSKIQTFGEGRCKCRG